MDEPSCSGNNNFSSESHNKTINESTILESSASSVSGLTDMNEEDNRDKIRNDRRNVDTMTETPINFDVHMFPKEFHDFMR